MGLRLTNNSTYEWLENEVFQTEEMQKTIEDYKKELTDTDYKVIKCMEFTLTNNQLPYDIIALHEERQAIRGIINELEASYGTNQ